MRANVRAKLKSLPRQSDPCCNVPCFRTDVVARLKAALPDESAVRRTGRRITALSDPARVRILHALSGGEELCVCDVAHVLSTSISTASHHLRRLRDLGILQLRNDGRMAYYSIWDLEVLDLVMLALKQGEINHA